MSCAAALKSLTGIHCKLPGGDRVWKATNLIVLSASWKKRYQSWFSYHTKSKQSTKKIAAPKYAGRKLQMKIQQHQLCSTSEVAQIIIRLETYLQNNDFVPLLPAGSQELVLNKEPSPNLINTSTKPLWILCSSTLYCHFYNNWTGSNVTFFM